jgi:hypothetical protein
MDIYTIRQGESLPLSVSLMDDQGNPITTYVGTEQLRATVWPGGNLQAAFSPTAAWVSGPLGTVSLLCSAAQTAGLEVGRYSGTLDILDATYGWLEAFKWSLQVQAAPGSTTARPSYCNYGNLLKYGRKWLPTLLAEGTDGSFAEECADARDWLDNLIIARYPTSQVALLGDPGYGSLLWGSNTGALPSVWLRQLLAGGGLVIRPWVIQATAKKAVSIIAKGMAAFGDSAADYRYLGNRYETESSADANANRAEIAANLDGVPSFAIMLGSTSMRPTFCG